MGLIGLGLAAIDGRPLKLLRLQFQREKILQPQVTDE
jgi:hypothetical protein